jgi:hypothetical protein
MRPMQSSIPAAPWIDESVSHLVVSRPVSVSLKRLAGALRAPRAWLGAEVDAPEGVHRYEVDMRLRVSDRPSLVTFRRAAYLDLGEHRWSNDGWEVDVSWRASSLAPLFPVFSGRIVARDGALLLSGWYAAPSGLLRSAADGIVLRIAATGIARWLLASLEAAAQRQPD